VLIGDKNWWPSKTPRQLLEAARRRTRDEEEWFERDDDGPTVPIAQQPDGELEPDDDLDADDGYAVAVQTASRVNAAWRDD
ncbi:MAG: putative drug exporter of the superfamily, partial [Mycobacterium sp.]|nr:putative drug exporter of the superfamily [Mycobacterium sp.]